METLQCCLFKWLKQLKEKVNKQADGHELEPSIDEFIQEIKTEPNLKLSDNMEEKTKLDAIIELIQAEGGFFLVSYDLEGNTNVIEGIGDNKAAYQASKLSDCISKARMEYMNWRGKYKPENEQQITEKK